MVSSEMLVEIEAEAIVTSRTAAKSRSGKAQGLPKSRRAR
jgi:hypothetical protein